MISLNIKDFSTQYRLNEHKMFSNDNYVAYIACTQFTTDKTVRPGKTILLMQIQVGIKVMRPAGIPC